MSAQAFPLTRAALAEFDATKASRDALWDLGEREGDHAVDVAYKADLAAEKLVRDAFQKDTADINRPGTCDRVKIEKVRFIVRRAIGGAA